jgi:hypothetical protein
MCEGGRGGEGREEDGEWGGECASGHGRDLTAELTAACDRPANS